MEEFSEPDRPAKRVLTPAHYDAERACPCGGEYAIVAARTSDAGGEVVDVHDGECPDCGRRARLVVDVGYAAERLGALLRRLRGRGDGAADA